MFSVLDTERRVRHFLKWNTNFGGVFLSHIATIVVCDWIGLLTPSVFVSTYDTIAGLLFPTMDIIMETKMNCLFLGAL